MNISNASRKDSGQHAALVRRAIAQSRAAAESGDGELAALYARLAKAHLDRHLGQLPKIAQPRLP